MDEMEKDRESSEHNQEFESKFAMPEETKLFQASRPDIVTQSKPEEAASFVSDKVKPKQIEHCFSPGGKTFPSSKELEERLHQLINDMNAKRKRDRDMLDEFRKDLEMQVSKICGTIEEAFIQSYEQQGQVVEEKILQTFAAIERIRQLESELGNFKEALGVLYTDMHHV